MVDQRTDGRTRWPLPSYDYWSTPFAESLLQHLEIGPGASILDIACGHGIPAFYLAEQVGSTGQVLAIDLSGRQVESARAIQGAQLPWLRFECLDMRALPRQLPYFDRITGNLSVMFFRPTVSSRPRISGTSQARWPTGADLSFARNIRFTLAPD